MSMLLNFHVAGLVSQFKIFRQVAQICPLPGKAFAQQHLIGRLLLQVLQLSCRSALLSAHVLSLDKQSTDSKLRI